MNLGSDRGEDARALAIITARLEDPKVQEHFTRDNHRKAATRALLDLLGVPLPQWAQRSVSGRAAVTKAAMDRFRADNPMERLPKGYVPKTR